MNVLSNYGTRILCSLLGKETCKMKVLHLAVLCILLYTCECGPEEEEGVKYADKCEVCKVVAIELESRLRETGKSHEVLELGYSIDSNKNKKRMKYEKSELRLVESLDGVCERILEYNIHKERTDSTRFAKGMSQTFKTLHGLVDKGVKVELGIPLELWDKPSVEITNMKTQCEKLIEEYESDIEDWYFHHQGKSRLSTYLCTDRALKDANNKCLIEELTEPKKKNKNKKNNRKGDQESLKEEL